MTTYADRLFNRKYARKYAKIKYHNHKAEHRCVECGKADDRTTAGMTYCAVCSEKRSAYYRARYQKKKAAKRGDVNGQQN